MRRTLLVLVGIALMGLATGAAAQSVTPLRLGVALGTSFGNNSWSPQGAHATVSLTSHDVGSRFGIRVEALFDSRERVRRHMLNFPEAWIREATIGLTVNGVYRLWGRRTGLYTLVGLGVYHRWSEYEPTTGEGVVSRSSASGLSANAGIGFDFKAFGRELFAESRLYIGPFENRVPLSLGIRF